MFRAIASKRLFSYSAAKLDTLAFIEVANGKVSPASLSAISAAKEIGKPVTGIVLGPEGDKGKDSAAKVDGLSKLLVAKDAKYDHYLAEEVAPLLKEVVTKNGFTHFITPASAVGKSFLPRLAALLDDTMFEDEPRDINLFMKATEFVSESIRASNEALAKLQQPDLSREERLPLAVDAALSNGLLFGFLGLQPWGLVPLVHLPQTHEDNKTDLLHVAHGLRTIVLEHHDVLLSSDIRDLYYQDELNLAPKKRVKIVEDLNYQLNEYLQGTSFFDIDAETAKMINAFHHCLHTLERVCVLGMKFNYPVMLFRWLLFVSLEINAYVRAENPFALRLLYVYACLCVHYKFWLFEQHNLWRDFVRFYRKHYGPLCEFDERLYHYVISKKSFVQNDDYVSIKDFDVWSPAFDYK